MHSIAFILSLIGGLVIVIGSIIAVFLSAFGSPYGTYYGMGPGMMGGFGFGYGSGWYFSLSFVALVSGIVVLIGAIMLNAHPKEHVSWRVIVLVFSLVSFIGMSGYFIGGLRHSWRRAIALSYRTPTTAQNA
jgi:hypothetical protein